MANDSTAISAEESAPSSEEQTRKQFHAALCSLKDCVEIDPKKLSGNPVLRGTRFPIEQVLSQIADGDCVDDIAENFDLHKEQLCKLLHALGPYLRDVLKKECTS